MNLQSDVPSPPRLLSLTCFTVCSVRPLSPTTSTVRVDSFLYMYVTSSLRSATFRTRYPSTVQYSNVLPHLDAHGTRQMFAPGVVPFALADVSLGARCWWVCQQNSPETRPASLFEVQRSLRRACSSTLFTILDQVLTNCGSLDWSCDVAKIIESNFVLDFPMADDLVSQVKSELLSSLSRTIPAQIRCIIGSINAVLARHHLPLLVCAVPTLLPKEHTHARLANGQPAPLKGPKAPTLPSESVLGDATSLTMIEPFESWYSFDLPNGARGGVSEELEAAERVLVGDFESYLRRSYSWQPMLWDVAARAPFRVCRPAASVTFAPTRFSPCYGLRALSFDDTSDDVTSAVVDKIVAHSCLGSKGEKEKTQLPVSSADIQGSIVRIPSKHPLHPLVCSLVQNQDESTLLVGDPAAELGPERADDGAGDVGGSPSGSSVAAIISKLPPHPLRALVQGMEDFMIQNDQRHRRLVQFIDFLCKRCGGSMLLMLKSMPARHRTRLNAAILDAFEKDDEDCFEVLGKPQLWDTTLKSIMLREYAVSVAMRPSTLSSASLIMTSTGAGVMNEQIGRCTAMCDDMLKGSYLVLGILVRLSEAAVTEEDSSSIGVSANAIVSPTKTRVSKSKHTPQLVFPFPLERLTRMLVDKIALALSDSSLEIGALLRVPPPPASAGGVGGEVIPMRVSFQSFASNAVLEKRLRKLLSCAFPRCQDESSLHSRFSSSVDSVVFGKLWPTLTRTARLAKKEKRRSKKAFVRPHELMCLEALVVLLDTMASVEKGCESSVVDSFYDRFVSDFQPIVAKDGSWAPPLFCHPGEVIQWLCGTASPYYLSSPVSGSSQQTASSAAGLTGLGLLVETLAVRCYVCTVCDALLDQWDAMDDSAISEDEVGATGAFREFNFLVEVRPHPMRARFVESLAARNSALLTGKKRMRDETGYGDVRYSASELVTGNVAESASARYAHSMLLTMPDTVTVTQLYEGY